MECLGQVLSIVPCLWECSAKHSAYITSLQDNLNSLKNSMDELSNLSQDVKNRVKQAEEQQHMKRTNEVNGWLQRVEAADKEVNQILQKGARELENKCPKNCRSSYKLGKKVLKMIAQVTGLTEKGRFDSVAAQLPAAPVDEQPMDNVVVGFESKFEEVWQCIQNKDSTIIGLVGMGGVGKTTLLKQVNNEFLKATHGYDLVIWIVVSRPVNLERIRDTIRSKLNIQDDLWLNRSEDQRVGLIFNKLKKKKFVVLLDDIWEGLELSDVGIPQPSRDKMSRVVFTTRSREVCQSMDANKLIEVGCLPPDQALNLFCSKVGEDMLKHHQEIKRLVKDVARECQGLPLALITIGRAMRGKTQAQQWKDAKRALEKYPSTFPGMEGRVFSKLVFSYDSLPTQTLKNCFKYCSIFPEDHNIEKEEIIKLWIAEGLIDEYGCMHDGLVQGRQIVESLMQASLLETGQEERTIKEGAVKMHDVIRDMALWLACERGEKKNKFWVEVSSWNGDGISTAPNVMAKWKTEAEKVSVWGRATTVESLVGLSFCSHLVTLIIQDTRLEELPGEIFHSMQSLKVLHLSYNGELKRLPMEIGCLTNLEYLNIIRTGVRRLPVEVSQLKKLRVLIVMEDTIIQRGVVSGLLSLQMFEQHVLRWDKIIESERKSIEREMVHELEGLNHIMDLFLVLTTTAGIQILLNSPKLQQVCASRLLLKQVECLSDVLDLGTGTSIEHLKRLQVDSCHMPLIKLGRPSMGNSLCDVSICGCNKIQNLNSLVYVPNLSTLTVISCPSLEKLVTEDAEDNVGTSLFSCLTSLTLEHLRKLRSICPQSALPFPSLEFMRIRMCQNLGKLPLDSTTAITTPPELEIQGQKWWWDGLEWDSQATKNAFTPKLAWINEYGLPEEEESK